MAEAFFEKRSLKSIKSIYILIPFLYFYIYFSKNHQHNWVGNKVFFFKVSNLLLQAIIWDMLAFFNSKSHCYWSKLDFIFSFFSLYVFVEFKVVLRANKLLIWFLTFDLCYNWYYHFFLAFLHNFVENQKTKIID